MKKQSFLPKLCKIQALWSPTCGNKRLPQRPLWSRIPETTQFSCFFPEKHMENISPTYELLHFWAEQFLTLEGNSFGTTDKAAFQVCTEVFSVNLFNF